VLGTISGDDEHLYVPNKDDLPLIGDSMTDMKKVMEELEVSGVSCVS
jgi:hypothetical protein